MLKRTIPRGGYTERMPSTTISTTVKSKNRRAQKKVFVYYSVQISEIRAGSPSFEGSRTK